MVNKLGLENLNTNLPSYYTYQRNSFTSYVLMNDSWVNNVVYIQLDALALTTNQIFIVDLMDPNTIPEGSKVTIFNNLASSTNPVDNVVQINYILDPPCPARYVYDGTRDPVTCAFCPYGTHYNDGTCIKDSDGTVSSTDPIYTDPLYITVALGAGQGATFIVHRYIPYGGFYVDSGGSITFDQTPPEMQLRTWRIFQYIQPVCNSTGVVSFCSSNNNIPSSNCTANNNCPSQFPATSNADPNTGDDDVTPQNCTYQLCDCSTGTLPPFCT